MIGVIGNIGAIGVIYVSDVTYKIYKIYKIYKRYKSYLGEEGSRKGGVFGMVSFFCNFVECDVLIRQRFRRFLMQLTLWRL